jgi:hypothetical protein
MSKFIQNQSFIQNDEACHGQKVFLLLQAELAGKSRLRTKLDTKSPTRQSLFSGRIPS